MRCMLRVVKDSWEWNIIEVFELEMELTQFRLMENPTTGLTIVRLVTAMLLGDKLLTDRGNGGGDLIPSYECYYPLVVEHDLGVTYRSDS